MVVEGIPPRDDVVTFRRHHASYNPGEAACFTPEEAQTLIDLGVGVLPPPPSAAKLTSGGFSQADLDALVTALTGVADGGFVIAIDGPQRSVRQDFTGIASVADVVERITASLGAFAATTIVGPEPFRFTITSRTVGQASRINYASPPPSWLDISPGMKLTAATGATITQGTD